jgi:hypothetical protein
MTDPQGSRRSKWTLDWPVMSRARVANDNPSPSVQTELIVFGCAIVLVFLLVEFHSALGF